MKGSRVTETMVNSGQRRIGLGAVAAGAMGALAWAMGGTAMADDRTPGGMDLLPAASQMMADVRSFDHMINWIIAAIVLFVLVLLIYVVVRFNRKANPTPKSFTHNVPLEVAWTALPVVILAVIAVFSFPLLFKEERIPKADITIKAIGKQWFWTYEYPQFSVGDDGVVTVDSNMLPQEDSAAQNRPYLLATDEPIYVPLGSTVELLVTAADVIHAFALPQFGVKEDAIPGRVNQGWFTAEKLGTYYGQCSELCGIKHAFMPIELRVVPKAEFEAWIASKGGRAMAEQTPAQPAPSTAEGGAAPAPAQPTAAPAQPG